MIYFYCFMIIIVLQRYMEILIAAKNERWMKERGGIEVGQGHYKYFILLHVMFFLFIIIEVQKMSFVKTVPFHLVFFIIFAVAQIGRIWCIYSLGKFWNTKIIVLPKVVLIKKGPYKYLKHPNYVIVFIELLTMPLIFGAYVTALIFPFLHLLLLIIRIPYEDKALGRTPGFK